MYLQNKYTHIYFNIIDRARTRNLNSYTESHHIIPKSLGGSNDIDNLVDLTAKEHFVCHLLLTKMVESTYKNKMVYALWMMLKGNKNQKRSTRMSSAMYSKLKEDYANSVRQSKLGKKLSEETKLKISLAKKGVPLKSTSKGKSAAWYEAHSRTHKGKSNEQRKKVNTGSDCAI